MFLYALLGFFAATQARANLFEGYWQASPDFASQLVTIISSAKQTHVSQMAQTVNAYPRVDADLKAFDQVVAEMNARFAQIPVDTHNKEWVQKKLQHMADVDQYMRNYVDVPFKNGYTKPEEQYFNEQFMPRWTNIDSSNTRDLKELLKIHGWFKVSEFGAIADQNAWLLVQHADLDVAFQKEVLQLLDRLYSIGETSPRNYAYLYDRVAVAEKRPQRFATQGRCVGPGRWEPWPSEEPEQLKVRRAAMGLEPPEDNNRRVSQYCHESDPRESP